MRIAFEASELLTRNISGLGRYVLGLGHELRALEPRTDFVFPLWRMHKRRRILANGVADPTWTVGRMWPPRRYDIQHATCGRLITVPGGRRTKIVATVHDLWDFHPESGTPPPRCERLVAVLERAQGVICVSESTLGDLRRYLPRITAPATVIHHGISDSFRPCDAALIAAVQQRLGLPAGGYLLYVGHHHSRKNIEGLLAGYARVADAPPLVLAGNGDQGRAQAAEALARRLGVPAGRLIQIGYVAEAELAPLIAGALGVVFVPLFEGFGFPLLEAYRCGTPAVCSGNSSLVELAHPSSPQVDPTDPGSVGEGISRLLARRPSAGERAELAAFGKRFTWRRCAERTRAFYGEVERMARS